MDTQPKVITGNTDVGLQGLEPKVPRGQKVRGKYVSRAALNKRHTTWPPPLKLTATPSSLMQLSAAERDPSETCG